MKKNKGFTLIELLAVIVILAIIAIIATPLILNVIEKARIGAFKDSILNAYNSVEYYLIEHNTESLEKGIFVKNLKLKNNLFKSGMFLKNENGKIEIHNIGNDKYCANGLLEKFKVTKGECDKTPLETLKIVRAKMAELTSYASKLDFNMEYSATMNLGGSQESTTKMKINALSDKSEQTKIIKSNINSNVQYIMNQEVMEDLSTITERYIDLNKNVPLKYTKKGDVWEKDSEVESFMEELGMNHILLVLDNIREVEQDSQDRNHYKVVIVPEKLIQLVRTIIPFENIDITLKNPAMIDIYVDQTINYVTKMSITLDGNLNGSASGPVASMINNIEIPVWNQIITFTNFNQFNHLQIPKDIIDNAVEKS